MLVVIVGFTFLDPLGETATIVFVRTPLDIRQYLTKGPFLTFLIQIIGKDQVFLFICLFPGRRLLLTQGMGMGGSFGTILGLF